MKPYMSQMSRLIFLIPQIIEVCNQTADANHRECCMRERSERSLWSEDVVLWSGGNSLFCNQGSYTRWITQRVESGLDMNCFFFHFHRTSLLDSHLLIKHLYLSAYRRE